jgi:hypothetical protein
MSHSVSPASTTNYIANFTTQYLLTMNSGTGGSVTPASGWTNSGTSVSISATASNGYSFTGWTGSGSGSYSGSNSSALVPLNGPITETANFAVVTNGSPPAQSISGIIVGTGGTVTLTYATTPGYSYRLQIATNLNPASWTTVPGSETNATDTSVTFTNLSPPGVGARYYRTASP